MIQSADSLHLLTISETLDATEYLNQKIKDFLLESRAIYPSIGEWWQSQVRPGLSTGERLCQVYMDRDRIAALSIVKNSARSSKLCTLRVREQYRALGLGQSLLQRAFKRLLNNKCPRIHYTISDEVMDDCGDFFSPYGFELSAWSKNRYVKGKDELIFTVERPRLLHGIKRFKSSQIKNGEILLLSIAPNNADLIDRGVKRVEFRRRFSSDWHYAKVYFYVTSPVKEIQLTASIQKIVKSDPFTLWDRFHGEGGVDRQTFFAYFDTAQQGAALCLSNIERVAPPIKLNNLKRFCGNFVPPQSYKIVRRNDPLFSFMANDI